MADQTDQRDPGPPPATGVRLPFAGLPAGLRASIDARCGAPVVAAETQPGGFSPGVAARLTLTDGRRCFVKAVHPSANPQAPDLHRREGMVVAAMPPTAPVPRWLWTIDEGADGWVVLAFEDVDGRQPSVPWRSDELDRVIVALEALAEGLTPSPIDPSLIGAAGDLVSEADRSWAAAHGWPARPARCVDPPAPGPARRARGTGRCRRPRA